MSNIQLSFPLPWNIVTKIGEYKGSQRKISTSLLLVAVGQLLCFKGFTISQLYPMGRMKYKKEKGI